jgi:uncharacterized protein YecT (DUF1311 family)
MGRLIILAAALLPLSCFAQRDAAAATSCYARVGHAEARACLEIKATTALQEMITAERRLADAMKDWDTTGNSAQARLKEANELHRRYRLAQCDLQVAAANGGNSATDRRLLCLIELDQRRALELRATAGERR